MKNYVLSVLVENKAGVLARVSGLFSARGFNIRSLAVAETRASFYFTYVYGRKCRRKNFRAG